VAALENQQWRHLLEPAMSPLAEMLYRLITQLHIAAGSVALLTFWIAGLARKGRGAHARVGRVYLWAMRAIIVTGLPMALTAFVRGKPVTGAFLSYLVVLVATTVYIAPRAVHLKHDFAAFRRGAYPLFAFGLPLVAGATLMVGIVKHAPLLWGFAFVGLLVGADMIRTLRQPQAPAGLWLREHSGAMIGNGVGTHIVFFSIGLTRLLPAASSSTVQNLTWFGPLTVALIVRVVLERRHRRWFAPRAGAIDNRGVAA
jgi:hypothetical protein